MSSLKHRGPAVFAGSIHLSDVPPFSSIFSVVVVAATLITDNSHHIGTAKGKQRTSSAYNRHGRSLSSINLGTSPDRTQFLNKSNCEGQLKGRLLKRTFENQ